TCGDYLVCFLLFARETAGASRTRHSLRPLFWANESCTTRAHSRRDIAQVCAISTAVILQTATASADFIPPPFVGRVAGRRPVGWGLSVQRVVTSPPPRPQLRCGRPSPLKGEGQERATSAGKRGEVKNNCRANHGLLRCARNDGVDGPQRHQCARLVMLIL